MTPPLEITVSRPTAPPQAGSWIPLTVAFKRPEGNSDSVRIRAVGCHDTDVQLDLDCLPHDVELRPGETYRVTMPIQLSHPRTLDFASFFVEMAGRADSVPFPDQRLSVGPSLNKDIAVDIEPLCVYEYGTRIQLTFHHQGATPFRDVAIHLGPEGALVAGKCPIRRARFEPGDREQVEVVIQGESLEMVLTAESAGERSEARLREAVPHLPPHRQRSLFRFLEARRLAPDHITVQETLSGRPIAAIDAVYPLRAGQAYRIVIRPRNPGVSDIRLQDIPEKLYVRNVDVARDRCSWTFLIEVREGHLWSDPQCLFYVVESEEGPLSGEIHLTLRPGRWKHLRVAVALGLALTVQGIAALAKLGGRPDAAQDDLLAGFLLVRDYPLLFSLVIPVLWGALYLLDGLQYRLRD